MALLIVRSDATKGGQELTNLDIVYEVLCRPILSCAVGRGCRLIGSLF